MTLTDWKNKGDYFNYKAHNIFYCDEGEGQAVLLIHGFPTSSFDWAQLWKSLAQNFQVISLDLLGFGFSDKPLKHNYNIFEQADIVEALLEAKGIEEVHIMSHDYGDTVAQELLARFNQRRLTHQEGIDIQSLCLLNGGLFPETHRPLLIQRILMSPLGAIVGIFFSKAKLAHNFSKIFGPSTQASDSAIDDFWDLITYNNGKKVFHLLIRYMEERQRYRKRWVTALQCTSIPLRLINGTFDPISGKHMVDRYRQLVPNPDIIELKQIGHFPLIEAPKAVLEHYLDFIEVP